VIIGDTENQTLHAIEPAHGNPLNKESGVVRGAENVAGSRKTLNAAVGRRALPDGDATGKKEASPR
jgi:hypothetical protein